MTNTSFTDFLKSLPSPTVTQTATNSSQQQQNEQQQQTVITTSSFLNNYQLPSSNQNEGGGKYKKSKQKTSKTNSSGPTKKVSQLIFHEYRGPNQKSSVSKTNTQTSSSPFNTSINSCSNSNNAFNFNESNDTSTSIRENELNSYKRRLEQQKIFFLYNETQNQPSSPLNNTNTTQKTQIPILPQPTLLQQQQQQQQQQQIITIPTTTGTTSASATTVNNTGNSIQILQIPDSLKTYLNNANTSNSNSNTPQILSIITNGANLNTKSNNNNNNCISIQPSTIQIPTNNYHQQQTQYASILPLSAATSTTNTTNPLLQQQQSQSNESKNLTILLPAASASLGINNNSGTNIQQHLISTSIPQAATTVKSSNIDEMTWKELKDECKRRSLGVSGSKQKLLERLKSSLTITKKTAATTTLQIVKSPDSGVGNMDYSPSITSCKLHFNLQVIKKLDFNLFTKLSCLI